MSTEPISLDLDRRSFMKASALAGALTLGGGTAGQALAQSEGGEGADTPPGALGTGTDTAKSVCNFCAVGCGFKGERKGSAFVGQEPWFENPINNGSLCAKGAAIYGSEHSPKRLKHPMKREGGKWKKITWDEAMQTFVDEYKRVRKQHGPDSLYWLGSAHHTNEEAYALRKLLSFMGTNNIDHQARICHSPTVAGLANTWGYGAMTNTINDYRNFDLNIIIGQNPAESHPIAMQHILEGQKRGGKIFVVEPRYTKTAAHADEFFRLRPGTDTALMLGLINYLNQKNAINSETVRKRVQGWPEIESELSNYDLKTVSDITWIDREDIERLAQHMIDARPNIQIEWAMGGTQHNNGTQNIRAHCLTALVTGGIGRAGGGLQVMRGHANIQGTTDVGPNCDILPGYYSVDSDASWKHWANVWTKSPWTSGRVTYKELYNRFDKMPKKLFQQTQSGSGQKLTGGAGSQDDRSMMFQKGLTVARWYESALPPKERLQESTLYQPSQTKIAVFHGHSANSITEMARMKRAIENLDLLVVIDLFPSLASVLGERDDGVLLLPAASPYEHAGSVTNSHRSVQWKDTVRQPSHDTKPDLQIIQEFAEALGFGDHFDWGSGPELHNGDSSYEDVLREINLGVRTIGYQMSPERLQQHKRHDDKFSSEDLQAKSGPVEGEYWSLPWPCWGKGHTGTPILWRDSLDPRRGGHDFRSRWGLTAPGPKEWPKSRTQEGYPSQKYPLEKTFKKQGQKGLNMMRAPYSPPWANGQVRGVPEYPGFNTVLPKNPEESDSLTLPVRYAFDPTKSVYDCAKALEGRLQQLVKVLGYDMKLEDYAQFDYKQVDPPTGRGRARAVAWNFFDPVPIHREPIESPRPDLAKKWSAFGKQTNFFRLDQNNKALQKKATRSSQKRGFDIIMTTGRQVEHQGGGSESRSNIFLADLQPHMYAEIHPNLAKELSVDGGDLVVVSTTTRGSVLVKARVTRRVNEKEVFLPFHWGGVYQGKSLEERYPDGMMPYAIGDSVNIITSPGYDSETQMQETKPAMVKVHKATESLLNELNMDTELLDGFPQDRAGIGRQKDFDAQGSDTVQ